MKRFVFAFTLLVVAASFATNVRAQTDMAANHRSGGLGFHSTLAPVGFRWWLGGQKIALDAGFGYSSVQAPSYSDEKLNTWDLDIGVPILMKSWDRVHLLFRPGYLYESEQVQATTPPAAFDTEDRTTSIITAELEAEVFLAENFSVSASHGVGFTTVNPPGSGDNITSFTTIGNNFTQVGFHVYFLGGGEGHTP